MGRRPRPVGIDNRMTNVGGHGPIKSKFSLSFSSEKESIFQKVNKNKKQRGDAESAQQNLGRSGVRLTPFFRGLPKTDGVGAVIIIARRAIRQVIV